MIGLSITDVAELYCRFLKIVAFARFPFGPFLPTFIMKYWLSLSVALIAIWLVWSGHFDKPFILILGAFSCVFSVWLASRMHIVDDEGAPVQMGIRPFWKYAPWLGKEIVESNIGVTKIVLSPKMPLHRNVVTVKAGPKSELGRVILANSITLTPGTVSVNMEGDEIEIHALSLEGAAEDISGEMDRRVQELERNV